MSKIQFNVPIPAAPRDIHVYNTTPALAPLVFFNQKLTATNLPQMKQEASLQVARTAAAADTHDEVHAFVNQTTGDAHLVPSLAKLVTSAIPLSQHQAQLPTLQTTAVAALSDANFIVRDATTLLAGNGIQLLGSQSGSPANAEPQVVMTLVPATRQAAGLRVYGAGSKAMVALDNRNTVVGALRRWNPATQGEAIQPTITVAQVQAEIERQLAPSVTGDVTAVVDVVTHGYYDAHGRFLQPVYRFEANLLNRENKIFVRVGGYVPMGKTLEPIPDLTAKPAGPSPSLVTDGKAPTLHLEPTVHEAIGTTLGTVAGTVSKAVAAVAGAVTGAAAGGVKPVITVGEFVNQEWPTNPAYIDMANHFMSGLNSVNGAVTFSRALWWTAYSWQVNGPQSKNYMNAVNVAFTVPHGDWLLNTCLGNYGDLWFVNKIGVGGNPGFGAAAGGKLSTWVIASCEVIPSMYDRQHEVGGDGNPQHAFDAWWGVFQGLHSVVGFRTIMFYPDDDTMYSFGQAAAQGVDVHTAWFQAVAAHHANEGTYLDTHINQTVHYDRASAIVDARNLGQPIYNVTPQSKATQLWNFWMNN